MNGFRSKLTDNNSDEATYVIFEPSFHTFQRDPPMLTLLAICTPDGLWLVGLAIQISSHFSGPRIFPVSDAVNHRLINGRKSADAETPDFDHVHPVCRLPIAPLRLGRFESVVACPLLLPMNIYGKLTASEAEEPVCSFITKLPVEVSYSTFWAATLSIMLF